MISNVVLALLLSKVNVIAFWNWASGVRSRSQPQSGVKSRNGRGKNLKKPMTSEPPRKKGPWEKLLGRRKYDPVFLEMFKAEKQILR